MSHSQTTSSTAFHSADTHISQDAALAKNLSQNGHAKKEEPFKSVGYRVHNELTYRGVDWLLNSTVGVSFTYWSERTKMGEQLFSRPVGKVFETLLTPILKEPDRIKSGSKWGTMLTGILVGGTAIVPIMTYLENKEHKKDFIHAIDKMAYDKERLENDPEFKAQDKRIDEESKKDFKTGIITRYVALAPIIAATLHPETNQQLVKYLYEPIGKVTKYAAEEGHLVPKKVIKALESKGAVEMVDKQEKYINNWNFIHRTIGFDFGLTFIYSFLHEITYKAMAGVLDKKSKQADVVPETTFHRQVPNIIEQEYLPNESSDKHWQNKFAKQEALEIQPSESHEKYVMASREDISQHHVIH